MGGTIALTVRTKDGTVHRMSRWTNGMPWLMNHPGIANESHFDTVIRHWYEEQDLPKKDRGLYSDSPYLAPVSYGLVVVDYVTNNIVYANNYCKIGAFYADLDFLTPLEREPQCVDEDLDDEAPPYQLGQFMRAKKLQNIIAVDRSPDNGRIVWVPHPMFGPERLNSMPREELVKFLKQYDHKYSLLEVKLGDFTVTRYDRSVSGLTALKARILELGFTLTPEDEAQWTEFLTEYVGDFE